MRVGAAGIETLLRHRGCRRRGVSAFRASDEPADHKLLHQLGLFDLRFGSGLETLGTCLLDVSGELGMDSGMAGVVRQFQQSRMGIYEHCGNVGRRIRLRELVTDVEFSCHSGSGYVGKPGELWYVRLCPPLVDIADYHVAVTTPYILTGANKTDWMAYLNRAMLNLNTLEEGERLYALLKYGLSVHH